MNLIPCTTGTVAVYTGKGGRTSRVPVEAWGDDGTPYVAGPAGLVEAAHLPGAPGTLAYFEAGRRHVVPGTGWEVIETLTDGDQKRTRTVPVVAFVLDADGYGTAVITDLTGEVEPLTYAGDAVQPSGGWPEFKPAAE